jgi:hypothetical protein
MTMVVGDRHRNRRMRGGDVYVPNSKDEEDAPKVATEGAANIDLAPTVTMDGATGLCRGPQTENQAGAEEKAKMEREYRYISPGM